jgi:hypothetical protein
MFDPPTQQYPKTWKEMSLDFKLLFVYHGCMMAMMIAGRNLASRQEIMLTGFLVIALVSISLRYRRMKHWHCPTIRRRDTFGALGIAILLIFFLFSAYQLFPLSDHNVLPWYFAGLGIGVFGILTSLRIVYASEVDFLLNCRIIDEYGREIERTSETPEPGEREPRWKKITRGIYSGAFLLMWTLSVASFFFFGKAFRHGSPMPTATQSEPLTDSGKTVFVTRLEKQRIEDLQWGSWVGIPIVLVGGIILHFLVGVKLFPNAPTLSEYLAEKTRSKPNFPPTKER